MERRDLLKGIAAAAGAMITGGGAAATKSLATPNTTETAADITLSVGGSVGVTDNQGAKLQLGPGAGDVLYSPNDDLQDGCLAELLHYDKLVGRPVTPMPTTFSQGQESRNSWVRRLDDRPKPHMPALAKLAETIGQRYPQHTSMLLTCVLSNCWAKLCRDQLPKNYVQVPRMVRATKSLGPERLTTCRLTLDDCDLSPWSLAEMLRGLLFQPLEFAKEYPLPQLQQGSYADPVPHNVYRLITPLRSFVRREAYIVEAYTYFEVFACYGETEQRVMEMLTAVAPSLSETPYGNLPYMHKDDVNKELGLTSEGDQVTDGLDATRGRLAAVLAAQLACESPAARLLKLGKLAIEDKVLYDVVYDTLRQLRDAGLVQA